MMDALGLQRLNLETTVDPVTFRELAHLSARYSMSMGHIIDSLVTLKVLLLALDPDTSAALLVQVQDHLQDHLEEMRLDD